MDEKNDAVQTDTEKDTQQDSSLDTNQAEDTHSSGGDNNQDAASKEVKEPPFHEHPRFKELIDENRSLKEFRSKYEPILSKFQPDSKEDIPAWFGGNDEAWKLYKGDQEKREESIAKKAIESWEARTSREKALYQEATKHFEDSVAEVEKGGYKVDKNRLLKITEERKLVDDKGRWNYKAGAEILELQDLKKSAEKNATEEAKDGVRKKIIDISKSEKSVDIKAKDYKTNEDFQKGRPW